MTSSNYSLCGKTPAKIRSVCEHMVPLLHELHDATDFDVIFVRGTSGTSIGYALHFGEYDIPAPIVIARKASERSHSGMFTLLDEPGLNGGLACSRPIFLDDFVSSGRTVSKLQADLAVPLVAVVCYRRVMELWSNPPFTLGKPYREINGTPVYEAG